MGVTDKIKGAAAAVQDKVSEATGSSAKVTSRDFCPGLCEILF